MMVPPTVRIIKSIVSHWGTRREGSPCLGPPQAAFCDGPKRDVVIQFIKRGNVAIGQFTALAPTRRELSAPVRITAHGAGDGVE
jgi:hypothetical protein